MRRADKAAVEELRDSVAAFCRDHGGTLVPGIFGARQYNSVLKGTHGATWTVPTRFGLWHVHEPSDPITDLVAINTRFEEPERISITDPFFRSFLNAYSGKWNHHVVGDSRLAITTFILDFISRSRVIFEDEAIPSCCLGVRLTPVSALVSGICGAPPGGCGMGRRQRITVEVTPDRTPSCGCGSELIRVRPEPTTARR